jgi:hypothetical protein
MIGARDVLLALGLAVVLAASGCSSASTSEETTATSDALTKRCTQQGDPPVTSGCDSDQTCRLVACTNSIPPSCWGTCQTKVKLPIEKCSGSFACLCGTPTCIDGEWTCVGNCGPGGETQ